MPCHPASRHLSLALLVGLALALPGTLARADGLAAELARALERHPEVASFAARDEGAAAQGELAAQWVAGAPSVSLANSNDRLGRDRGQEEWEAELALPLWLPGQQAARRAEAEAGRAEQAARRDALRLAVAGELREAWWALAEARAAAALAARRAVSAEALAADVLRRFLAGEASRLDANLARHERLAADAEAITARAAVQAGAQAWQRLTGGEPPAELVAETAAEVVPDEHPQLRAARAAARTARARSHVAAATRRDAPELAFRVRRERGEFGEAYANSLGVKLTIPFSSGPRVRQSDAATRAETLQAEAELALQTARLGQDVDRGRREFAAAEWRLALAAEQRTLTADNLRLAEKSYALGESDLVALLRARAAALEAEAQHERQMIARAAATSRLNQALGVLP